MKKFVFIIIVFLISCSSQDKSVDFFKKEIQNKDQRTIKGSLTAVDSIKLSTLDIYNVYWLRMNENHLFISGGKQFNIVNKKNFNEHYTINFAEGRGPDEVIGVNTLDVKDSLVALGDVNQRKVLIGKIPEIFKREIIWKKNLVLDTKAAPNRISIIDPDTYLVFSRESSSEFSFNIIDKKGVRINGFEKLPSTHDLHDILLSLKYQGYTMVHGNNIYYAGYAEPILKKYNLKGEMAYSVSTIDNYNTEANYMSSVGKQQSVYGYAPGTLFSTRDFDIHKNYWLVIPDSNGKDNFAYIDIYDEEHGVYIGSFTLTNIPKFMRSDDRFIYVIETIQDELYLNVYKNDIEQRLF